MTTASLDSDTSHSDEPTRGVATFLNRHRFALRRLHSLAGVVFGGYIVVHLLVNATLLEAAFPSLFGTRQDVYQQQVDKIHELPFLIATEWFFIYLPILFHAVYGMLVVFSGKINVDRYSYGKNWAYTAQRATSIILLFFIAFHVLTMKGVFVGEFARHLTFDPDKATLTTVNHLHAAWWIGWLVYPIGILAATFHLANGFWTAGITWGLTITKQSQRLWGMACVGLFLFTAGCGFASLFSALAEEPDYAAAAADQAEYEAEEAGGALTPGGMIDNAADAIKDAE